MVVWRAESSDESPAAQLVSWSAPQKVERKVLIKAGRKADGKEKNLVAM